MARYAEFRRSLFNMGLRQANLDVWRGKIYRLEDTQQGLRQEVGGDILVTVISPGAT